jgi:predicted membrane protein
MGSEWRILSSVIYYISTGLEDAKPDARSKTGIHLQKPPRSPIIVSIRALAAILLSHQFNAFNPQTLQLMERQMEFRSEFTTRSGCNGTRRNTVMFGLLMITFGVFWLLRQLEMLDPVFERAVFSWQAVIIAVGMINIVNRSSRTFGALLLVAGSFFMAMRLGFFPQNYSAAFWPVIVILIGVWIIFSSRKLFRTRIRISSSDEDYFEEVAVFGGSEKKMVSDNFRGGEVVAVFGGSEIDLTRCQLAPGTHKIELVAVFGGVKLRVPPDWNIKTEMVNVLGGFSDKRGLTQVDTNKLVIIEGVAIFGGGELTN